MSTDFGKLAQQEAHVLTLVQRVPGVSNGAAAWLDAGGRFDTTREPTGTVTITYPDFMRMSKISARLADLVRKGKITRGKSVFKTRGTGFYPVGVSPAQAARVADRQLAEDSKRAMQAPAMAGSEAARMAAAEARAEALALVGL